MGIVVYMTNKNTQAFKDIVAGLIVAMILGALIFIFYTPAGKAFANDRIEDRYGAPAPESAENSDGFLQP